ncbi:E3 ubiquitin-protein ligase E3D-like isoform X2 [Oscarella lobularis]|uniref:E3 ubiquitin-protein ligase E3D-like isoform X2 n=1 Tax=Oscarella lobularis TaxID=121494 RepID=UPI00331390E7
MAVATDRPPFSIEVQPRIGVARLCLHLKDPLHSSIRISPKEASMRVSNEPQATISFPEDLSLVATANASLVDGHFLDVRLRLAVASAQDDVERGTKTATSFLEAEKLASKRCRIRTRASAIDLVQAETIFQRFLPLPSDNWRDVASESWFCHGHCHGHGAEGPSSSDLVYRRSLVPRPTDCLYNDVYVEIHHSHLKKDEVFVGDVKDGEKQALLVVKKCRSRVGFAFIAEEEIDDAWEIRGLRVSHVSLWRPAISISAYDSSPPNPITIEEMESFFVTLLLNERLRGNHKFVILGLDKELHGCIWLMSTDIRFITNLHRAQKLGGLNDDVAKIEDRRILKVLYKRKTNELAERWLKEDGVKRWQFPNDWCIQLFALLTGSTTTLLRPHRSAEDFQVGYLRRRKAEIH